MQNVKTITKFHAQISKRKFKTVSLVIKNTVFLKKEKKKTFDNVQDKTEKIIFYINYALLCFTLDLFYVDHPLLCLQL